MPKSKTNKKERQRISKTADVICNALAECDDPSFTIDDISRVFGLVIFRMSKAQMTTGRVE